MNIFWRNWAASVQSYPQACPRRWLQLPRPQPAVRECREKSNHCCESVREKGTIAAIASDLARHPEQRKNPAALADSVLELARLVLVRGP
ncbi:hypothetical protein ACX80E_08970 [Arthrobacter sp. TMN-49]